jgi:hypothetical protein
LRTGPALPRQRIRKPDAAPFGKRLPQLSGLIETALPTPPPVKGNRHNQIVLIRERQGRGQKLDKTRRQGLYASVFVKMNQVPEGPVVRSVAVSEIETAMAIAAKSAQAVRSQRKFIDERRSAS